VNKVSSYVEMFDDISEMAAKNLLKFYPTKEKKDLYFEELELLIHLCEEIIPEIKSYKFVHYHEGQILTLKFLHQNLSYDYDGKTINYDSYFSALQNIQRFLDIPDVTLNPPPDLVNSCTQFIIYSYIISEKNCTQLFEYQGMDHLTHLAIFYIKKEIRSDGNYQKGLCKYPALTIRALVSLFTSDVRGEIRQFVDEVLAQIPGVLEKYNLDHNIQSFTQLSELQDVEPFKNGPLYLWNLKAMIALEKYLISHPNSDLDVD
jgi:hypothetical protein